MDINVIQLIHNTIYYLEINQHEQACIDNSYDDFLQILRSQMDMQLNPKIVPLCKTPGKSRKKAWWNEDLDVKWSNVRIAERNFTCCKKQIATDQP